MRNLRIVAYAGLLGLAGLATPPDLVGQQPARVTLADFRRLDWFQGRWLGSGGAYPAFYEEYRAVDDSTIQMRAFSDSTFRTATDSSRIELRSGQIASRSTSSRYVAVLVQADRIRFQSAGATRAGFTFTRVSADQWTATLHPPNPNGQETVYVMRRFRQ